MKQRPAALTVVTAAARLHRRGVGALAALVLASLSGGAATASASEVGSAGGRLSLRAVGNEEVNTRVALSGAEYAFGYDESRTSASGPLTPVPPCTARESGVACPAEGVTALVADLTGSQSSVLSVDTALPGAFTGGPGDDNITAGNAGDTIDGGGGGDLLHGDAIGGAASGPDSLKGGSGDDELYAGGANDILEGGPGEDVLFSGSGDDIVYARDGATDAVRCSEGTDRAVVDPVDKVDNCEILDRSAGAPGTAGGAKKCVVPKLKGKTLAEAKRALRKAGCKLGKVERTRSRRKAGTVIKQSVKPGQRRPVGTTIRVTVAKR